MAFDPATISHVLSAGLRQLPGFAAEPQTAIEPLADALLRYLALLEKWNKAYNLTAVRDPQEMVTRHLLDSLSANPLLKGNQILDAGTGAGLPGLPLALCNPDWQFTLLDANGKKVRFIRHVVGELGLANILPVQARVESYQPGQLFDCVVSRAFSSLADFVNGCGHLLQPDGCLLAMKGKLPQDELAALPAGWQVEAVQPVAVPGLGAERHIVVLRPC